MLYESYFAPKTVEEVMGLLANANGQRLRLIAGGTDLMIQLQERVVQADGLIDVSSIPELQNIWLEGNRLYLGASVTFTQLIESELVREYAYLLAEASRVIGAPQIQHMGTIGGNLANASPAGDTLPCLVALQAEVTLSSTSGRRQMPVSEFITGVRKTALRPDELITSISFDTLPANAGSAFNKLGLRRSQAISVADAAAVLFVEDGNIADVCIALCSVAPTIVRSPSAEKILQGQKPSAELLDRAAEAAREDISPITDIRASATYRTYVVKPLVKEALEAALRRVKTYELQEGKLS